MARLTHVMEEHILRCEVDVLSVIVHKRWRSQSGEESGKVSGRLEKFVMSLIFHFSSLKLLKMIYIYEFPKLKKILLYFLCCFEFLKGNFLILFSVTGNVSSIFVTTKAGWEMEVYTHPDNFAS